MMLNRCRWQEVVLQFSSYRINVKNLRKLNYYMGNIDIDLQYHAAFMKNINIFLQIL